MIDIEMLTPNFPAPASIAEPLDRFQIENREIASSEEALREMHVTTGGFRARDCGPDSVGPLLKMIAHQNEMEILYQIQRATLVRAVCEWIDASLAADGWFGVLGAKLNADYAAARAAVSARFTPEQERNQAHADYAFQHDQGFKAAAAALTVATNYEAGLIDLRRNELVRLGADAERAFGAILRRQLVAPPAEASTSDARPAAVYAA